MMYDKNKYYKKDLTAENEKPLLAEVSYGEQCHTCHYLKIGDTKIQTSMGNIDPMLDTIDNMIGFLKEAKRLFLGENVEWYKREIKRIENNIQKMELEHSPTNPHPNFEYKDSWNETLEKYRKELMERGTKFEELSDELT